MMVTDYNLLNKTGIHEPILTGMNKQEEEGAFLHGRKTTNKCGRNDELEKSPFASHHDNK